MSSQRFCLRWNNHQSNLLSVFDQLLQDESFVDVTLAVDGRNLKAHKIVLSACSPYFQALFVGHPDRHPIVILKDIPYVDMRSLLDFMYRGEVSVDQDRLTMFLKVAESLRIKGLTEASGDKCDNLSKMGSSLSPATPLHSGSMSMSYQQRLKRPLSASQHSLNSLQSNNPLLGTALAGPKRKRGLPRKLSGSLSSGLDMPDMDEPDGRDEEEFEDDRSVLSDGDMIERAHSPFDNKMLEVNVQEGKPPHRPPSSTGGEESSANNMEERGEGRRSPSPEREDEGEGEEKQTVQDMATNVKKERESDATSGGDQNERNSSPVPERFPPGRRRYQRPERPQPKILPESLSTALALMHRPRRTISKSITYELNPDVSLTRGIIYDAVNMKEELDLPSIGGVRKLTKMGELVDGVTRKRELCDQKDGNVGDDSKISVKAIMKRMVNTREGMVPRGEAPGRVEVKEEAVPSPQKWRRSKRMKLVEPDFTEETDEVNCEDVLRSLTNSGVSDPGEQDGYCEESDAFGSGVHFLTSETLLSFIQSSDQDSNPHEDDSCSNGSFSFPHEEDVLTRKDLLEYLMKQDGSCVCKLCGQILASRTHWYRHKYKVHTPAHLMPPTTQPQEIHTCKQCNQYFKSKKGYLGHVHAKHNADYEREVAAQTLYPEPPSSGDKTPSSGETKIQPEPRMSWIKEEKDYTKVREMEDQLVKDIIAKVREECEREGSGMMRKGYTKKMRK